MGRIFISSDYHFNHDREFIWKARGFKSVDEMNETIIANHNAVVAPEDDVYLLGDLALGGGGPDVLAKNKALIERLNGKLHVIWGNHDTPSREKMYVECKNVCYNFIPRAETLNYKGYHFYLSHFPTLTSNLEKESLKQCTLNLFGHTHQETNFYQGLSFLYHVGVDSHNCYPVLLDNIIEDMKQEVNKCFEQL